MEDEKLREVGKWGGLGEGDIRMAFFAEKASRAVVEQKRSKEGKGEEQKGRRALSFAPHRSESISGGEESLRLVLFMTR